MPHAVTRHVGAALAFPACPALRIAAKWGDRVPDRQPIGGDDFFVEHWWEKALAATYSAERRRGKGKKKGWWGVHRETKSGPFTAGNSKYCVVYYGAAAVAPSIGFSFHTGAVGKRAGWVKRVVVRVPPFVGQQPLPV